MSTNTTFELGLTPPPGVAFIQWGDGTIRIRYATKDVVPIRKMLIQLAKSLTEQAVSKLKEEREAEIAKQRMPLTRLQRIQQDMKLLQGEMSDIEKEAVDLSAFESIIEENIAIATTDEPPPPAEPPAPITGPVAVTNPVTITPSLPVPLGEPTVVKGIVSRDDMEYED